MNLESDTPIHLAIERLIEVINFRSGSSFKISAMVWSLWNGNHVVGLWDCLAGLDAQTGSAILSVIRARLELGGNADPYIKTILEKSGEFDRYWKVSDKTLDGEVVRYPIPYVGGWRLKELAAAFGEKD